MINMDTCPRLAAVLSEARGWLADCFDHVPASLTNAQVQAAVNKHYAGGWDAFVIDTRPLWVAIPLNTLPAWPEPKDAAGFPV
jgi:hypothetical protein